MMCDLIAQYGICTTGAEYQYRDFDLWCTGCYFHDVAQEERKLDMVRILFSYGSVCLWDTTESH